MMQEITKAKDSSLTAARPLTVIEAELEMIKQDTRQKEMALLSNYIEVGRRLEEAKAQLHHGEWGNWLKKWRYPSPLPTISCACSGNTVRISKACSVAL